MKFSLCIESVLEDMEFYDRIAVVADCGADAIELWDPSVYDTKKIAKIAQQNNLPVAVCGLKESWTYRLNSAYDLVEKKIKESIPLGKDMGCNVFIGLAGETECKVDSQKSLLIENMKRVAEFCEKEEVIILIEPLNSLYDHKGYYLDSSYVGFEIVKAVNTPAIKLLYDCYHMQIMEGNLINNIRNNIDFIGHFHSAGVPGRNELHRGETNYPFVIQAVEDTGYDRFFGLEYWPSYDGKRSIKDVLTYVRGDKA